MQTSAGATATLRCRGAFTGSGAMREFVSHSGRAREGFRFPAAPGKLILVFAMLGLLSTWSRATAHHSFAAEFSYELFGTREGEVVELHYVNPHTRIFVAVANDGGEVEIWDAQTHAISILLRSGWMRDTVKVGDKVVLAGFLGLENSRKLWIAEMTLEDGRVFTLSAGN